VPLVQRKAEAIQLRLEARQSLFESGIVLMHRAPIDDTQNFARALMGNRAFLGWRVGGLTIV
jgi:hypothetical protein